MAFGYISSGLPALALALPLIVSPASQAQVNAPAANPAGTLVQRIAHTDPQNINISARCTTERGRWTSRCCWAPMRSIRT